MNAYELADKLQELDAKLHLIVLFKSAEMLRQQADRIAKLEKQALSIWDSTRRVYENCQCDTCKNKTSPQTKPLSNDEIREIGDDCELKNNGILNWIEFARAIEERHGIK